MIIFPDDQISPTVGIYLGRYALFNSCLSDVANQWRHCKLNLNLNLQQPKTRFARLHLLERSWTKDESKESRFQFESFVLSLIARKKKSENNKDVISTSVFSDKTKLRFLSDRLLSVCLFVCRVCLTYHCLSTCLFFSSF